MIPRPTQVGRWSRRPGALPRHLPQRGPHQKVLDLFAAGSADYDGTSATARTFSATIQNKLIFAVTGSTAAELVLKRADAGSSSMGLTTWAGDRVRKVDVTIAKNYLAEPEIAELNRLTTMFLDFAEDRAQRRQQTLMTEWVGQTDRFLAFNERNLLAGSGRVSAQAMQDVVAERYAEYDQRRRAIEAGHAEAEELDDLRALMAIENPRVDPEQDEDSGTPR